MASTASSSPLPAVRPPLPSPPAPPLVAAGTPSAFSPSAMQSGLRFPPPRENKEEGIDSPELRVKPRENKEQRELREAKELDESEKWWDTRARFLQSIIESCISVPRTTKPEDSDEWSYAEKDYHGFNICPESLQQGDSGICLFCAVHSAAQMELNASYARAGQKCNIQLHWNSRHNLVNRFLQLHGFRPGYDSEAIKRYMLDRLIDNDRAVYDWTDASFWCFQHMGVAAKMNDDKTVTQLSDKLSAGSMYLRYWEKADEKMNKYMQSPLTVETPAMNICIESYEFVDDLIEGEVWDLVLKGRGVVANVRAGKDFDYLEADEIYCWIPKWDKKRNKWIDPPSPHAVLLIGNGNAGPTMKNEQFHPFLNWYGEEFAKDGVGCVFFKGLFPEYRLLNIKKDTTHTHRNWHKVERRPDPMPHKSSDESKSGSSDKTSSESSEELASDSCEETASESSYESASDSSDETASHSSDATASDSCDETESESSYDSSPQETPGS